MDLDSQRFEVAARDGQQHVGLTEDAMHIVMGGTGHIGSAVAEALLDRGETVTIIVRDPRRGSALQARGATMAVADVLERDRLNEVFRSGRRAFLLNPPAAPQSDTDAEEIKTIDAIIGSLRRSNLERIVLESTYGAQPGTRKGDLSTLHHFEREALKQPVQSTVIRAAYYMSNWDLTLDSVKQGILPTMFPPELKIPMVAAHDIGQAAAGFLTAEHPPTGVQHVEGPSRYSPADVAAAFSAVLGRPVQVRTTPREKWFDAYRETGFSAVAADCYARMTAIVVDGDYDVPASPRRGSTTLQQYISRLVEQSG
jgi:uncharacterized protein YbjT (DUF2867 family)